MKLNRLRYLAQVSLLLIVTLACAIGVQAQSGSTKWSAPTDLGQSSNTDYGAWGAILCDQYQNAHIVWSDMARNGAALFYSTDAEGSWSLPADVIMQPGQGILRTTAAISNKTDTLHVAWVDDEMGSNVYHSKSPLQTARNAHSWSTPVLLSSQHPGEVSMTIDQAGVLHVIYPAYLDGYQLGLYYTRSEDDGTTWSDPVTVYITTAPVLSGISLRSAIDAAGRLHVGVAIRSAKYGIYSEVGYLRSPDGGRTWTPYRQLFASKLNPTGGTGAHRQPCSYGAFCLWQGWNSSDVARPAPHAYVVNRRWRYVERAYGDNAVICGHRRHEYAGARQCRRHPRRVGESGWCIFGPLA